MKENAPQKEADRWADLTFGEKVETVLGLVVMIGTGYFLLKHNRTDIAGR
ncbi:hypothetical protein [Geoalkalibacter subterraneus]|nr:hypothetical protein [Geoalkalibacter subterraneus]